ncbi:MULTISPECIES: hypothetical protein [Bacillus]|uniref:Uncharacterized protein n=2 Tax=Bacillus thuringiensis TaxID=1428 RepID=A0AAP4V4B7_BACTU|nr:MULTISPECIES: hypothetical protein [Bacillus]KIQ84248.1 hypothetical protein RT27_21415 [Bacillus sp. L_1B0_5]MDA2519906.1 hypothetical protein [Bacillus cereus]AGG05451.1 hypothetical protein H175_328p118 [Bacillus thuringiensis serovar thuringiensis str. IS5056]ERH98060.1 hypothetical protein BTCBT_005826 [Bacillus thuringiensis T01-328]KIQ81777.1 hypothetical protein RW25_24790 [Bacillus sp. L_1B0_8]
MKMIFATFAACTCLGLSTISASVASTETSGEVNLNSILIEYREKGLVDIYRFSPTQLFIKEMVMLLGTLFGMQPLLKN